MEKVRVLQVEDSPDHRALARAFAEISGIGELVQVTTCQEALEQLSTNGPFNLIILDTRFDNNPEAGIVCAKRLIAQGVSPGIIIGTSDNHDVENEYRRLGIKFIPKINWPQLFA